MNAIFSAGSFWRMNELNFAVLGGGSKWGGVGRKGNEDGNGNWNGNQERFLSDIEAIFSHTPFCYRAGLPL